MTRVPTSGFGDKKESSKSCEPPKTLHAQFMLIAWTTVENLSTAKLLAEEIITKNLAVCVQIDHPVYSVYSWQGKVETAQECRLMIKLVESQAAALEAHISANHPYKCPEWITVQSEHVAEKYLSWAETVSTRSTL